MFTDAYAQQSCTAGRAAFILGEHPFRTGLLTIGMPGSRARHSRLGADHRRSAEGRRATPPGSSARTTWATATSTCRRCTDSTSSSATSITSTPRRSRRPTTTRRIREFRKKYGPRGVIQAAYGGRPAIEDTGPLTRKRMETVDEEFHAAGDGLHRHGPRKRTSRSSSGSTATRMHVWTRLKKEAEGRTGIGLYPDGMVEHDGQVGPVPRQTGRTRHRRQHHRGLQHRQRCGDVHLARRRHHAVPRREGHDLGRRLPRPGDGPLAGRDQAGHGLQRDHVPRGLAADLPARCRRSRTSSRSCKKAIRPTARRGRSISTATTSCRSSKAKSRRLRASRSSISARAAS